MTNPQKTLPTHEHEQVKKDEPLAPYLQKILSAGKKNQPVEQSIPSEKTPLIPVQPGHAETTKSLTSSTSSLTTDERLRRIGFNWRQYLAPSCLAILIALPMAIFRRDYFDFIKYTSYAPLCGLIACSIPSGGAPVAGGIVFLPILTIMGIEPHNAVAFTAATQMLGVGVFTPLGWLYRDPGVIMLKSFLLPMLPIALLGLLTGLLVLPLQHADEVLWAFTIFIIILAYYTGRGLIKNELKGAASETASESDSDDDLQQENQIELGEGKLQEEKDSITSSRDIKWTFKAFAIYAICIFFGGMLTSWIGIGVEKITFLLLTAIHDVDVVAAGLSSITLVGWLSLVAFGFHAMCAPPEDGPGPHWVCAPILADNPDGHVGGNVPYELWLAVLPGTMLGSLIGPKINAFVGPRNIMIIFVIFLIFDIVFNITDLLG